MQRTNQDTPRRNAAHISFQQSRFRWFWGARQVHLSTAEYVLQWQASSCRPIRRILRR